MSGPAEDSVGNRSGPGAGDGGVSACTDHGRSLDRFRTSQPLTVPSPETTHRRGGRERLLRRYLLPCRSVDGEEMRHAPERQTPAFFTEDPRRRSYGRGSGAGHTRIPSACGPRFSSRCGERQASERKRRRTSLQQQEIPRARPHHRIYDGDDDIGIFIRDLRGDLYDWPVERCCAGNPDIACCLRGKVQNASP